MDTRSPWDFTELCQDAIERLDCLDQYQHSSSDIDFYSWLQRWPNSGCGFGGVVCHACTEAQTVVAVSRLSGDAVVYHKSRFAYRVPKPSKTFWDDCRDRRLAGASELDRNRRKEYQDVDPKN